MGWEWNKQMVMGWQNVMHREYTQLYVHKNKHKKKKISTANGFQRCRTKQRYDWVQAGENFKLVNTYHVVFG